MKKLLWDPQPYFEPSCLLSCAWHSAAGVEWAGVCLHPQVDELASCQGPTSTSTSRAICWWCWHARGVGKAGTRQVTCVSLSSRRTVVSKAAYVFASPGNCMRTVLLEAILYVCTCTVNCIVAWPCTRTVTGPDEKNMLGSLDLVKEDMKSLVITQ